MLRFPPLVQEKTSRIDWKQAFLEDISQLGHQTVPVKPPYKAARLVHYDYDMSKRWHIVYWAWDEKNEKLKRIRLFDPLNREKNRNRRIQQAEYMVRIINGKLYAGQHLRADSVADKATVEFRKLDVSDVIRAFIEQKRKDGCRQNYVKRFDTLIANWNHWLNHAREHDFPMKGLTQDHLHRFFDFMRAERKISNTSWNNYRTDFMILVNWVRRRHPTVMKSNPVETLPRMKAITRKHAALNDAQIKLVQAKCKEWGYTQLLLMINFIYYTLARPGELRKLRIRHIEMDQSRLFIPGTISKNKTDEYVSLPEPLKKLIRKYKLLSYDPDLFIFGKKQIPGPDEPYGNTFWERNATVLEDLGLTDRPYDIYSYKHSGAINLYKATKDMRIVQRQCRHASIEQTNTYLRDLAVMDNYYEKAVQKWKGAL